MSTPGTYWTFGTKACEVHTVVIVEFSANGAYATDDKRYIYMAARLFTVRADAIKAARRYLDRKQAEIDKRQAEITRRREFINQQARVFA